MFLFFLLVFALIDVCFLLECGRSAPLGRADPPPLTRHGTSAITVVRAQKRGDVPTQGVVVYSTT